MLRQAFDAHRSTLGDSHPDTHMLANNLADLLRDLGKYEEAEMLMRAVLSGLEEILGIDHPNTKIARENLEDLLDAQAAEQAEGGGGGSFRGLDEGVGLPTRLIGSLDEGVGLPTIMSGGQGVSRNRRPASQ